VKLAALITMGLNADNVH